MSLCCIVQCQSAFFSLSLILSKGVWVFLKRENHCHQSTWELLGQFLVETSFGKLKLVICCKFCCYCFLSSSDSVPQDLAFHSCKNWSFQRLGTAGWFQGCLLYFDTNKVRNKWSENQREQCGSWCWGSTCHVCQGWADCPAEIWACCF